MSLSSEHAACLAGRSPSPSRPLLRWVSTAAFVAIALGTATLSSGAPRAISAAEIKISVSVAATHRLRWTQAQNLYAGSRPLLAGSTLCFETNRPMALYDILVLVHPQSQLIQRGTPRTSSPEVLPIEKCSAKVSRPLSQAIAWPDAGLLIMRPE